MTRLAQADAPVGTAPIAYAEMYSGLTRRHRDGDLSAIDYASACRQFERDWTGYLRIRLAALEGLATLDVETGAATRRGRRAFL